MDVPPGAEHRLGDALARYGKTRVSMIARDGIQPHQDACARLLVFQQALARDEVETLRAHIESILGQTVTASNGLTATSRVRWPDGLHGEFADLLPAPPLVHRSDSTQRRLEHHAPLHAIAALMNLISRTRVAILAQRPIDCIQAGAAVKAVIEEVDARSLAAWIEAALAIPDIGARHAVLITGIMASVARVLADNPAHRLQLTFAALTHDIGKVLIPPDVLRCPGPLDEDALRIMRQHTTIGHDILLAMGEACRMACMIARNHHEMLDGSGYPDGLSAPQISRDLRLATICDIFTALIEPRSYKRALTWAEALEMMRRMGGRIDEDLLGAFSGIISRALQPPA